MKDKLRQTFQRIDPRKRTSRQLRKHIIIELAVLLMFVFAFVLIANKDYQERPGILKAEELVATDITDTSITLQWKSVRNTDSYSLFYTKAGEEDKPWNKIVIDNAEKTDAQSMVQATVNGLETGTDYCWFIRADNDERAGFKTDNIYISTRNIQEISVKKYRSVLKKTKHINLDAKAETKLSYESSDEKVAKVNKYGKVKIKQPGTATITITAEETDKYLSAKTQVKVVVLDTEPEKSSDATAKVIYRIEKDDCEPLVNVTRGGTPQALAFTGDSYIVTYDGGKYGLATYALDGTKQGEIDTTVLGHANGFTYCSKTGLCYGMRGYTNKVDVYDPKTGEFDTTKTPYGAASISYDRAEDVIYTGSRACIRVYSADGKFNHERMVGNCTHKDYIYTQDCTGYAGIVARFCSGSNKHKVNYIDLYRIADGTYLGSLFCDFGEVESGVVDEDGYLLLLINSKKDYIWKTPINIADIAG